MGRTKTVAPICPSLNLEVRKSLERGKAAGRGQSLPVVGVGAGMEDRALAGQERCAKPDLRALRATGQRVPRLLSPEYVEGSLSHQAQAPESRCTLDLQASLTKGWLIESPCGGGGES